MSYKTLPLLRKMSNNNSNWKSNAILGKMERHRNDNSGNDEYTKLLLHMDGIEDGTTFTDDSASNHIITRHNALTKTSVKKFGTASGYFDGIGDYLSIPNSADWDFGTANFTIDFWFYMVSAIYYDFFFRTDSDIFDIFASTHIPNEIITYSPLGRIDTSGGYCTISKWHHYAYVRNGNSQIVYIDGHNRGSSAGSGSCDLSTLNLRVGLEIMQASDVYYVDELRISKGIARWTENFTPPVVPYS